MLPYSTLVKDKIARAVMDDILSTPEFESRVRRIYIDGQVGYDISLLQDVYDAKVRICERQLQESATSQPMSD